MAFTASLRRSLFVLLGASALVFMFFYWNQNGIRTNQFLADLDKPLKNKLVVLNGEMYACLYNSFVYSFLCVYLKKKKITLSLLLQFISFFS